MSRRSVVLLLSTMIAAFIAAGAAYCRVHFVPAELTADDLWTRHPERYTSLSPSDYQVLSAFLNIGGENHINIVSPRSGSVLAPVTAAISKPIPIAEQRWMKSELPGLEDDTLASFHGCMKKTAAISARFLIPDAYKIASFADIYNIETLYKDYPTTNGYIQFSCVGYNSRRTQALFWVERKMSRSAVGMYVLMAKNSNGVWIYAGEMVRWIA